MCSIKVGYANALSLGQIAAKKKERGHFEWAQNEPKLGRNKDEGDASLSFLAFWGDVLWNIQRKVSHHRAMQEFQMSHQMSVIMTQNINRCYLKNKAGVRYAKRTPNIAAWM